MRKLAPLFAALAALGADRTTNVLLSKHNLSVGGPGPVSSQSGEVCLFCHTPHSSYPDVKLISLFVFGPL